MGNLTDKSINGMIRAGERFELSDGSGLTLAFRESYRTPAWRLRYRIGGKARVAILGSYGDLSLADARATAKELRARVTLGFDVAAEIQQRKREAGVKIEAARNALTVAKLADRYFERNQWIVEGKPPNTVKVPRWKHPDRVRALIERDIKPNIGKLPVEDVTPVHIDDMLQAIKDRGARTTSSDVLRLTQKIFGLATKLKLREYNPAAEFSQADAGGVEKTRERALTRDELVELFGAMRKTPGFSIQNALTFKLLLLLAVRKSELCNARVSEFDLKASVWALPADRTKTEAAIDIPLSAAAVKALRELLRLCDGSDYLLPARKAQDRMLPHIHENTLNVALSKVRRLMPDVERFHIHDLRRTARTHLAALGVESHIAERCLNHKLKGVEGTYNKHDYFEERRTALAKWADFVEACETAKPAAVALAKRGKSHAR